MEYGCIGEKLGHSFSGEIHEQLADYQYELLELRPEEVGPFLTERLFHAINVTIPYKETVMPFLDSISPEAREIGAVNTIVNRGGRLFGYNTDLGGMSALLLKRGISLSGKKIAVLGSGGTSKTAFAAAKKLGAAEILRVSRSERPGFITYDELYRNHASAEVVINTTPCGMFPKIGVSALDLEKLPALCGVMDAVYNPLRSKLVCDAEKRGIKATGGLYMLVSQAAGAVREFTGQEVPEERVNAVFKALFRKKENIVLIGLPGSGKTTVGVSLAKSLRRDLFDTDEAVVRAAGKSIPEIFRTEGEAAFRSREAKAIYEASQRNGLVIATGGGAVKDQNNTALLRENGRLYFLDRPTELIASFEGRPLSGDRAALEKLAMERRPLYLNAADVTVKAIGNPESCAEQIAGDFNEDISNERAESELSRYS